MSLENLNEVSEGLNDHLSHRGGLESYTPSEMSYIREIIPPNWEGLSPDQRQEAIDLLDNRLAELSESGVCRALDSDPQIKQVLSSVIDEIPVEMLEAPHDHIQTDQISDRLYNCEELRFENWRTLELDDKVQLLNTIECDIARIEHRPSIPVYAESLGPLVPGGRGGGYNMMDKTITVNSTLLEASSHSPERFRKVLDVLIHEGRHAYQDYNMNEREVHPRHCNINSWRENVELGYEPGDASEVGLRLYWCQPLETDAREFAQEVIEKLNLKLTA